MTNNNNIPLDIAEAMIGTIAAIYGEDVAREFIKDLRVEKGDNHVCVTNIPLHNAKKPTNVDTCKKPETATQRNVNEHNCFYGATNVEMNGDGTRRITILLPGFKKEGIKISYLGKVIKVVATAPIHTVADELAEGNSYKMIKEGFRPAETIKREFAYDNAMYENTQVSFEDGVLTLIVPAHKEQVAKEITF